MASASLPQASAAPLALSGKVSLPLHEFLGLVDKARDNGDVVVTPPPVRHLSSYLVLHGERSSGRLSAAVRCERSISAVKAAPIPFLFFFFLVCSPSFSSFRL